MSWHIFHSSRPILWQWHEACLLCKRLFFCFFFCVTHWEEPFVLDAVLPVDVQSSTINRSTGLMDSWERLLSAALKLEPSTGGWLRGSDWVLFLLRTHQVTGLTATRKKLYTICWPFFLCVWFVVLFSPNKLSGKLWGQVSDLLSLAS